MEVLRSQIGYLIGAMHNIKQFKEDPATLNEIFKSIVIFSILLFILSTPYCARAGVDPNKEKKFETIFVITYNSITLAEAAKLEKLIREIHEKACKLEINLKDLGDGNLVGIMSGPPYTQEEE